MKESLLNYLVCPLSKCKLELYEDHQIGDEILNGVLRGIDSHIEYPIINGVPSFVKTAGWTEGQRQTRESFSHKWRTVPNYRKSTEDFYIKWYLERYGFGTLENLQRFCASKKFILDAGTGTGRDSKLYSENSPALVFGIDLSDGIFIAYEELKAIPNLHLIQADLTCLPFQREFFDLIACDQVIHHTPDTHNSFNYLLEFLQPGGHFLTYVYKKKGPIREFCDDLIRDYFSRLSFEECLQLSRAITAFGRSLSNLKVEIQVPEDISVLGIKAGQYDLQRFLYWNIFKCYWNDQMDEDTNVMTNFDWYHPTFAYRHTPEEVRQWCEEASLTIVHFNVVESGTSVRVMK